MDLDKKFLDLEDIRNFNPKLESLTLLPHGIAQQAQVLLFDIEWKNIKALTTNNHINAVNQITEKIELKWYKLDFYFIDDDWFNYALTWYEKLLSEEDLKNKEIANRLSVENKDAINMIKQVYEEKNKLAETEFIKEVIRLWFMSWASDIHFQCEEMWVVLRLRRDGVLKQILVFTHLEFKKYLIKLKNMSWVKFNTGFVPQDGRLDFIATKEGIERKIDVRVSFMPALHGESIVMRFLDSSTGIRSLTDIGFRWSGLEIMSENIKQTHGMILITWPTGSGKSTTMYSILDKLNLPTNKIITLEDPVEYEVPWLQQSQIYPDKGYGYAEGLKSILRQDPDIIMVWEIRDLETAEISINAALTWHLVLATLHTNTAIEAVSRLLNMWVKPFMLAPALNLVVGQRLLRKLCDCKIYREAHMWENEEVEYMIKRIKDASPRTEIEYNNKLPEHAWCEKCLTDGYIWRTAAIECFEVKDSIKEMILNKKSTLDMYSEIRTLWFLTMKEDAYIKMLRSETTMDEIRRVLG